MWTKERSWKYCLVRMSFRTKVRSHTQPHPHIHTATLSQWANTKTLLLTFSALFSLICFYSSQPFYSVFLCELRPCFPAQRSKERSKDGWILFFILISWHGRAQCSITLDLGRPQTPPCTSHLKRWGKLILSDLPLTDSIQSTIAVNNRQNHNWQSPTSSPPLTFSLFVAFLFTQLCREQLVLN